MNHAKILLAHLCIVNSYAHDQPGNNGGYLIKLYFECLVVTISSTSTVISGMLNRAAR
jgi:hypothetical protein